MKNKIITSLIALSMVMSLTACNTDKQSDDHSIDLNEIQQQQNYVPPAVEISEPEDEVTKASYNFMKKFLAENISDKTCVITMYENYGLENEAPEKKYVYYEVNIDGSLYDFIHEVEDDSVYSGYSGQKLNSQLIEKLMANVPDESYDAVTLDFPAPYNTIKVNAPILPWDMTSEELLQYLENCHKESSNFIDEFNLSITYRNADSDKLTDTFTHISAPMFDLPITIRVTNYKASKNFPEFNYIGDELYLRKFDNTSSVSLDIDNRTEMAVDNILVSYNKYVDLKVKKKSDIGSAKSELDSHVFEPHEYVAFYEIDGTKTTPPKKNMYETTHDGIPTYVTISSFINSVHLLDTKNPQYQFASKNNNSLSSMKLGNDSHHTIILMDKDILGEYKLNYGE